MWGFHNPVKLDNLLPTQKNFLKKLYLALQFYYKGYKSGILPWGEIWEGIQTFHSFSPWDQSMLVSLYISLFITKKIPLIH